MNQTPECSICGNSSAPVSVVLGNVTLNLCVSCDERYREQKNTGAQVRESTKAYVKLYTDYNNTRAELWRLQNTIEIYQSKMEVLSKALTHIMNYKSRASKNECKCGERAEKALRDINYLG